MNHENIQKHLNDIVASCKAIQTEAPNSLEVIAQLTALGAIAMTTQICISRLKEGKDVM